MVQDLDENDLYVTNYNFDRFVVSKNQYLKFYTNSDISLIYPYKGKVVCYGTKAPTDDNQVEYLVKGYIMDLATNNIIEETSDDNAISIPRSDATKILRSNTNVLDVVL